MKIPLILAIETSGRSGSVAIAEGEKLLGEKRFSEPMRHSMEVFPAIKGLLAEFGRRVGEIEEVYVSIGPGSYTGLRIGVTLAKMLSLAQGVKIVTADTLDVIAANTRGYVCESGGEIERVGVILDAKRGQFFAAVYENKKGVLERVVSDCVIRDCEFIERFVKGAKTRLRLLGEGLVYYRERFSVEGVGFFDEDLWWPRASKVHLLGWEKGLRGEYADALALQPSYFQRPDAKVKGKESGARSQE